MASLVQLRWRAQFKRDDPTVALVFISAIGSPESGFHLFYCGEFSALPSWRALRRVAGHKLVVHTEQVSQNIGTYAREANQHGAVADVMVRHVVDIRGQSEQFGAVIEI